MLDSLSKCSWKSIKILSMRESCCFASCIDAALLAESSASPPIDSLDGPLQHASVAGSLRANEPEDVQR